MRLIPTKLVRFASYLEECHVIMLSQFALWWMEHVLSAVLKVHCANFYHEIHLCYLCLTHIRSLGQRLPDKFDFQTECTMLRLYVPIQSPWSISSHPDCGRHTLSPPCKGSTQHCLLVLLQVNELWKKIRWNAYYVSSIQVPQRTFTQCEWICQMAVDSLWWHPQYGTHVWGLDGMEIHPKSVNAGCKC